MRTDMNTTSDEQLATDEARLARVTEQADAIRAAYAELMQRLRREMEASFPGPSGAPYLRG